MYRVRAGLDPYASAGDVYRSGPATSTGFRDTQASGLSFQSRQLRLVVLVPSVVRPLQADERWFTLRRMVDTLRIDRGHEGTVGIRPLLSTLWVAVLLTLLFRDIHEILRDGYVSELALEGTVYGVDVSGTTLVISAFVFLLPLSMVVLARLLTRTSNRVANIAVAAIVLAGVWTSWPKDGDDLVFGVMMSIGLGAIVALSVRWRDSEG